MVGSSSDSLINLAASDPTLRIDVMLIDHMGKLYEKDLMLAETYSLLSPQAVVIADKVLDPNASNQVAIMGGSIQPPDTGRPKAGTTRDSTYVSRFVYVELQLGEQSGQVP